MFYKLLKTGMAVLVVARLLMVAVPGAAQAGGGIGTAPRAMGTGGRINRSAGGNGAPRGEMVAATAAGAAGAYDGTVGMTNGLGSG